MRGLYAQIVSAQRINAIMKIADEIEKVLSAHPPYTAKTDVLKREY